MSDSFLRVSTNFSSDDIIRTFTHVEQSREVKISFLFARLFSNEHKYFGLYLYIDGKSFRFVKRFFNIFELFMIVFEK